MLELYFTIRPFIWFHVLTSLLTLLLPHFLLHFEVLLSISASITKLYLCSPDILNVLDLFSHYKLNEFFYITLNTHFLLYFQCGRGGSISPAWGLVSSLYYKKRFFTVCGCWLCFLSDLWLWWLSHNLLILCKRCQFLSLFQHLQ